MRTTRRPFTFFALLSLVPCVATAVLWAASYGRPSTRRTAATAASPVAWQVTSARGSVTIEHTRENRPGPV